MSNDTATLKGYLDTQLNDTGNTVWGTTEKTNLIDWALAELWPQTKRVLDPTTETVSISTGTYFYALPSDVLQVSRVEWIDVNSFERGQLTPGTWEITGDPLLGTGKIHVAPAICDQYATGTLRLHGYGRYDGSSHYIPNDYIESVLAKARAEAYRRIAGDRARYKEWQARQQTQNISVNELTQLINEADNAAERLRARAFTWTRPTAGRV